MQLALLKYNNYYNRKILREHDWYGYSPYLCGSATLGVNPFNCSFKINDGVSTQQVINWDGDAPDYVIAIEDNYKTRISKYNQLLSSSSWSGGGRTLSINGCTVKYITGGRIEYSGVYNGNNDKFYYSTYNTYLTAGRFLISGVGQNSGARMELCYFGTYQSGDDEHESSVVGYIDYTDTKPKIITIQNEGYYAIRFKLLQPHSYLVTENNYSKPSITSLDMMYPGLSVTIDEIMQDLPDIMSINGSVIYDGGTPNEIGNYCSRWFVVENERLRQGQWKLTLHRDVIADHYDAVITAPTFIEKATVSDDDPAIFNKENMSFNQIKKQETLLMDRTRCKWIVGYINREVAQTQDETVSINQYSPSADISINGIQSWEYYNLTKKANPYDIDIYHTRRLTTRDLYTYTTDSDRINYLVAFQNFMDNDTFENIKSLDGKVIYDSSTSKYYHISINMAQTGNINTTIATNSDLWINLVNITGHNDGTYHFDYKAWIVNVKLEQIINENGITAKISKNRNHLEDAPYDMFAIPVSDDAIWGPTSSGTGYTKKSLSKEFAMRVGMAISRQYSGTHLYDIQLLPYCPLPLSIYDDVNNEYNCLTTDNNVLYNIVYSNTFNSDNEYIVSVIFWAQKSSFTTILDYSIDVNDIKLSNECDLYRLCSPNYSGSFEFSAAKNYGVNHFDADCTYMPITPYIHINPSFNGLYGTDYNDARGLICGGDFSLPVVNDSWFNYLYNNKNYQNTFDRSIEHLEINNAFQKQSEIVNALAGGIAGTTAGAVGGMMLGGPAGAIAGGIIGAAGNVGTGIADIMRNEKLRNENLDYTKDQFGYQLQNIAARPNTLAKVTAFNYNNKGWPFIEYYSCTDEEKIALKNKLKYDGMTVMRIGSISDYIQEEPSYIKGQLIRLEGITEDYHMAVAIATELNKGVFI